MRIMNRLLVAVVILATCSRFTDARTSGAPDGACGSMVPAHSGTNAMASASPHTIVVGQSTYAAGDTISVTLRPGGSAFKGFLIQARVVGSNTAQGSFGVVSGTKLSCSGKGLTHDGSKTSGFTTDLVLQWTAPSPAVGHIEFFVTFVQTFSTYWVREKSSVVQDPTAPALTTQAPVTQGPSIAPFVTTTCGSAKGCYRDPPNCEDPKCDVLVTWTDSGSNVDFELMGKSDGYVALGLSQDKQMGSDSVIDCKIASNGAVVVQNSYNDGKSNSDLSGAAQTKGISNAKGSSNDGILRCTFSRAKTTSDSQVKDLGTNYHLLLARGKMSGGFKSKHSSPPAISPDAVALTGKYVNVGGSSVNPLIKVHGCLMILAWIMCASIGILIARYMKPMWHASSLCGEKVWFAVHRSLMITALLLVCISFIIIFVSVNGYSMFENLPDKAHPILGIIVTCLCVINPIMALFRPHPDAKYRPIFNWFHWGVGTVAHVLAVPTIFLGMGIPKAFVYWWLTWVLVAWVIIHVVIELTLEIHQCCMHKKNKDRREEFEMRAKNDPSVRENGPKYAGSGFKSFMLGLHITITVCLTLVLVIGVALGPL